MPSPVSVRVSIGFKRHLKFCFLIIIFTYRPSLWFCVVRYVLHTVYVHTVCVYVKSVIRYRTANIVIGI